MLKNSLDVQVPFFIPLWRRVVVAGAILGWAVFELLMGEPLWALLFGAIGIYMAHQFFFAWNPEAAEDDNSKDET